jgi:lysophospholipase L1-like esterase
VSGRPPTGPAGKALGALSLVVPLTWLLIAQAVRLQRRYGTAQAPGPIDVTVAPAGVALPAAAPLELATFGDSAVAGVGVDRSCDALPVQLAQRVADRTGRPVHVTGYARSGARTVDVLTGQVPQVRRAPDVSVLVVGTNDVTRITPPGTLARVSGELLDALEALGAPVVMSSLPEFRAMRLLPRTLMVAALGYGGVIGAAQRRTVMTRPRVRFVDVRGAVGWEFVADRRTMSVDSFHPSAAGYGRIADALVPAVAAAIGPVESLRETP